MSSQVALVGDIGGTNARFALFDLTTQSLQQIQVLACKDYDNIDQAITHYLAQQSASPDKACLAFACPVHNAQVHMTNNHWHFDKQTLKASLGLQQLRVINDFTALALALPVLPSEDLCQVGEGKVVDDKPKLVLGPGTGMGVAGLVRTQQGWLPIPTEGGHVDFAPRNELEVEVWRYLHRCFEHVSVERILSGSGLANLYQALAAVSGQQASVVDPSHITTAGCKGSDKIASQTLDLFSEILGSVAGNAALTIGALGGVYIAGGIIPRFKAYFVQSGFRNAFIEKGRFREYLSAVPTYLVLAEYPGLLGATQGLLSSERLG
ncbi:glucokinase [Zooshikella harenae]|uniref:Glucokinase n=1 Tax=Zooshikella harenae TaxID=2827238 RepID=A0ABS5Z9C2_9GAMM|nr:glucokinase [Zooshikella harenae]MBU2710651.1 glucokinase [Zooshikella harenae]